MKRMLSSSELSEMTQIPERTLDQWAYLRKGPAFVKIGRHRRYRESDVEAWLAASTHGGESTPSNARTR